MTSQVEVAVGNLESRCLTYVGEEAARDAHKTRHKIAGAALSVLVAAVLCWLFAQYPPRLLPAVALLSPTSAIGTGNISFVRLSTRPNQPGSQKRRRQDHRLPMASPPTTALRRVLKKAPDCRRFKAKIWYRGELFSGWQKQGASPDGRTFRTIEETLERSIRPALGQTVSFFPAGRTDAGVSATGQCVTFDAMLSGSSPGLCVCVNCSVVCKSRLLPAQECSSLCSP